MSASNFTTSQRLPQPPAKSDFYWTLFGKHEFAGA